jgi:hypothetical protein
LKRAVEEEREMIKVMGLTEQQCIREETEYRDWKKCPLWYCVKTLFNMNTGKMESEIVRDEKTKQLIAIQDTEKPLDGVYETASGTIYYTYHRGYAEAAKQVAAATI